MTFILSGGGDAIQTEKLDSYFKTLFQDSKKILYMPWAFYPDRYPSCYEWITSIFSSQDGFEVLLLDEKTAIHVDYKQYDALYIGGGNTYRLLHLVRDTGYDKIISYFASHKLLYGGSAGALILTENISSCSGDINIYNYSHEDCKGLNLTEGINIFCHYKPKYMQLHKDFTKFHTGKHIALGEGYGLVFEHGGMYGYGEGECDVYENGNVLDEFKIPELIVE